MKNPPSSSVTWREILIALTLFLIIGMVAWFSKSSTEKTGTNLAETNNLIILEARATATFGNTTNNNR